MESFTHAIGILGSIFVIGAYFLLQSRKVTGNSYFYLYINLFGAVFIIISLYYAPNLPTLVLELFWVAISVYGLWKRKRSTL